MKLDPHSHHLPILKAYHYKNLNIYQPTYLLVPIILPPPPPHLYSLFFYCKLLFLVKLLQIT